MGLSGLASHKLPGAQSVCLFASRRLWTLGATAEHPHSPTGRSARLCLKGAFEVQTQVPAASTARPKGNSSGGGGEGGDGELMK